MITFCVIKDKVTEKVLLKQGLRDGLYQISSLQASSHTSLQENQENQCLFVAFVSRLTRKIEGDSLLSTSPNSHVILYCSKNEWHNIFGHPSSRLLNQLLNSSKLKSGINEKLSFCEACQFGKSHRLPFSNSISRATNVLDLVHTDL